MTQHNAEAAAEELAAFREAYGLATLNEVQQLVITASCLPTFLKGYRAAKSETLKPDSEQVEARQRVAQLLKYPEEWDVAAYPNLEMAVVEALHTKELEDARLYTMDQMRDFADGMISTRINYFMERLGLQANEWDAIAARFEERATDITTAEAAVMRRDAKELRRSISQMRAVAPSFQRRAGAQIRKIVGGESATDPRERNYHFFQEAAELMRACDMTKGEMYAAIDYVFDRKIGSRTQEVGSVMIALAALCVVHKIDMFEAAEVELLEICDSERNRMQTAAKYNDRPDFAARVKDRTRFSAADFLELIKEHSPIIAEMLNGNKKHSSAVYLSQEGKMLFDLLKKVMEKIEK
jgi:hypothetical protein